MQKADKGTIKKNNKQVILNSLKNENLSRTELTEKTGLSASTVGVLVAELLAQNVIFEKSVAESSGGRKPIILSINPECAHILLIKLQQNRIETVLLDLQLRVSYQSALAFSESTQQALEKALEQSMDEALAQNLHRLDTVVGVGVSVPGMVDFTGLTILYSARLHLKNFKIGEVIARKLNRKIYLFRDADAFMLGEAVQSNLLHPLDSCVYLRVDNGVGLSYMRRGEIVQFSRSGFELGHVPFAPYGPLCSCGNYGCLEALVSIHAVRRELGEYRQRGAAPPDVPIESLTLSDAVRLANDGHTACREILTRQYAHLGRAAALTANLFAPDVVFIGGPLCDSTLDKEALVRSAFDAGVLTVFSGINIVFTRTDGLACYRGMADRIFIWEFFGDIFSQGDSGRGPVRL